MVYTKGESGWFPPGRLVGVGGFARTGGRLPEPPTYPMDRAALALTERGFSKLVGVGGFEPPTSRSRTVRSSLTELHPDAPTPIVYDARPR